MSDQSHTPNTRLDGLLERIEAIGHQEKALLDQLKDASQHAQTLFEGTGQVRHDILALKAELAKQPAPETPKPKPAEPPPISATIGSVSEPVQPKPSAAMPNKTKQGQWELTLGIKWFSRIGIVALLIGVALGLNYAMPYVSSEVKLLLGGLSALGLFLLGSKLRENMTVLGHVLQAGGLSLGYVSVFAMFFFPSIAVIHNDTAGYITLAGYVGFTMVAAHRIRSQIAALLSLAFGYYTASFCGHYEIAFIATTGLSLAALGLSYLNQEWRWVSRACVLGYLGTVQYWMQTPYHWYLPAPMHQATPQAWITAYLWTNMALFHIASLLPHRREDAVLNIVNSLGFYTTVRAVTVNPLPAGGLEGILCLIQLISVAIFRLRPDKTHTSHLYTSFLWLGLGYLGLATCARFSATTETMVLALEALVIGLASRVEGSSKHLKLASFLFWTYGMLSGLWVVASASSSVLNMSVILSAFSIALVGFLLESFVVDRWNSVARWVMLIASNFLVLLTIWLEVPGHWITVTETITGLVLLTLGFVITQKKHRWMGLGWLALAMLHLIFVDIASLAPVYKVVMFLVLGGGLLGASFGYNVLAQKEEKGA